MRDGIDIKELASSRRIVVGTLDSEPAGWDLPGAQPQERTDIAGGIRTLHELAVAIAACGREVELRGPFSSPVLDALSEAAGARPLLPTAPRRPRADDIVVFPNGGYDHMRLARIVLSPAQVVIAVLSPTGQSGWPFVSPWHPQPHLTVELDSLCRPEHFRAMAALNVDLWTNMLPIPELAQAQGASCTFIGSGEPNPLIIEPALKDVPVTFLEANRWGPLAKRVSDMLATPAQTIAAGDYDTVMAKLARAQIMLWPARVEGDGRLLREARARGTVVVGLASNIYATGLNEQSGAIAVDTLERMAEEVEGLLADPDRLQRLAQAGRDSARDQVDWDRYLERVELALARTEARRADPAASARAAFGERLGVLLGEGDRAIERVGELDEHLADAHARVAGLDRELDAAKERIEELESQLRQAAETVPVQSGQVVRSSVLLGGFATRVRRGFEAMLERMRPGGSVG